MASIFVFCEKIHWNFEQTFAKYCKIEIGAHFSDANKNSANNRHIICTWVFELLIVAVFCVIVSLFYKQNEPNINSCVYKHKFHASVFMCRAIFWKFLKKRALRTIIHAFTDTNYVQRCVNWVVKAPSIDFRCEMKSKAAKTINDQAANALIWAWAVRQVIVADHQRQQKALYT